MTNEHLIVALLGKVGYDRLNKSVTGADLGSYVACRATAAWFSQILAEITPGSPTYVDVPGTKDSKLYLEKTEDGNFRGELIKGGAVQYRFAKQPLGDWQTQLSAVPFTLLAEAGVKVNQSYAKNVPDKLNKAIDTLVTVQLSKTIKMKEVQGDYQTVKPIPDFQEGEEEKAKAKRNNPRKIKEGQSVAEIDMLEHEEAAPGDKPLKGKMKKDEKSESLTKPPVSEAQRRAMHAAASGHSTLGIPKSVGKEFSNADKAGKLPQRVKKAAPGGAGSPTPAAGAQIPKSPSNKQMPKATNSKPAAVRTSAPKAPRIRSMGMVGMGGMGMGGFGKSETFRLTESEIYRPCLHCGTPEFKKSEDGQPRFNPCACFASETQSFETGKPRRFCQLVKGEDGSMKLSFHRSVDPEAKRLFLLLLKGTLLSSKINQE